MSWGDKFWSSVYDARRYLRLLYMFLVLMLLLTSVSFWLGKPSTSSRSIAYINLMLIVFVGTLAYGMYWYAARRATTPYD